MSKDITTILKEAVGESVTQETLDQIETLFNESVDKRSTIRVEKALIEQDESHASKLKKLLEAIDTDHTSKLEKVAEALDRNHSQKLIQLVKKYENTLNSDAGGFKNNLVESISNYIEEYIDEALPVKDIQEAVRNKKAVRVLESLRSTLGVDMALSKSTIKNAIQEGKQEIDNSHNSIKKLTESNQAQSRQITKLQSHILLNEKVQELPQEKARYMHKVLADKTPEFITENFEYTLKLFNKTEEEKLASLKQEAVSKRGPEVDRPIVESAQAKPEESQSNLNPLAGTYMGELSKF